MARVFHYPQDNINTDMMFPGKYTYGSTEPEFIKEHLFEDLDPRFHEEVQPGDFLIAGANFGCGSSREQPGVGLKLCGVQAVIARSFARIFYRSATNQGLLLIECPEAVEAYREGDAVTVDARAGRITMGAKEFHFPPLPPEMQEILDDGGLLAHLCKKLA